MLKVIFFIFGLLGLFYSASFTEGQACADLNETSFMALLTPNEKYEKYLSDWKKENGNINLILSCRLFRKVNYLTSSLNNILCRGDEFLPFPSIHSDRYQCKDEGVDVAIWTGNDPQLTAAEDTRYVLVNEESPDGGGKLEIRVFANKRTFDDLGGPLLEVDKNIDIRDVNIIRKEGKNQWELFDDKNYYKSWRIEGLKRKHDGLYTFNFLNTEEIHDFHIEVIEFSEAKWIYSDWSPCNCRPGDDTESRKVTCLKPNEKKRIEKTSTSSCVGSYIETRTCCQINYTTMGLSTKLTTEHVMSTSSQPMTTTENNFAEVAARANLLIVLFVVAIFIAICIVSLSEYLIYKTYFFEVLTNTVPSPSLSPILSRSDIMYSDSNVQTPNMMMSDQGGLVAMDDLPPPPLEYLDELASDTQIAGIDHTTRSSSSASIYSASTKLKAGYRLVGTGSFPKEYLTEADEEYLRINPQGQNEESDEMLILNVRQAYKRSQDLNVFPN